MSGSWDAMLADEAARASMQTTLQRRRELARLTKPDLISLIVSLERTADHA